MRKGAYELTVVCDMCGKSATFRDILCGFAQHAARLAGWWLDPATDGAFCPSHRPPRSMTR